MSLSLLPWAIASPAPVAVASNLQALPTVPVFPLAPTNSTILLRGDPVVKRFTPGSCGVHVREYQKNEGPGSNTADYRFDIYLYDRAQDFIGTSGTVDIPDGSTANIGAPTLPYLLLVTSGHVDSDPIYFAYAGQQWSSNSGQCSVGKYDGGDREMDCGFNC